MRRDTLITNLLLSVLLVLIGTLVYMQYMDSITVELKINNAISKIKPPKVVKGVDGIDGKTPIKGVDYFDGENGKDGVDSKSTHTIEKETVITELQVIPKDGVNGKDGKDGLTPFIRCNTSRNRWEYRNSEDDMWASLNNESVPCKGIE